MHILIDRPRQPLPALAVVRATAQADAADSAKAVAGVASASGVATPTERKGAALVIRQLDSGRFVYELRDSGTGRLLRQFPAEALVELSRLVESGMLLDVEV